ncbi:protein of unknown function [Methylomagnum ishizawai]|uniref:DUF2779 domain-containing protein n=1 Tax=Methylomagnum ishizawai TaxID=1760988 RepID=A0A1Y6CVV9_9GAMM|nr:DUF2779 domain-containing protein [Methylomagnum ishizawai]SMF94370.1 protein of unknown function [Methylomagnum ishizawai]
MSGLSKSRLLAHRQCPKRLWLQVHKPILAPAFDAATQARLDSGNQVGVIARALHPGGLLIEAADLRQALRDTAEALLAQPTRPLFEATFEHGGVLVRLDLLLPAADGYRLIEVKSSTSIKDYHLPDAAVQAWVARQAGLTIQEVAIGHIDNGFVYPGNGDYRGLLKEVSVDAEIQPLLGDIPQWVAGARSTLDGGEPSIAPGPQCETPFPCPFLEYCAPPAIATEPGYSVDDLPRGKSLAEQLRTEGYDDLRDVPVDRLTNPLHQRVQACAQNGSAYLDPQAKAILGNLPYPRFFIDFETYAPCVPIWPGTRPYAQVPFQWSCHVESVDGGLSHQAYLAEGPDDPRRPFTESLLSAVRETGPVFVYNAAFERSRLREMTGLYSPTWRFGSTMSSGASSICCPSPASIITTRSSTALGRSRRSCPPSPRKWPTKAWKSPTGRWRRPPSRKYSIPRRLKTGGRPYAGRSWIIAGWIRWLW